MVVVIIKSILVDIKERLQTVFKQDTTIKIAQALLLSAMVAYIVQALALFGATLVHVVSSAVVGFGLGYVFYKGYFAKIIAIIIGLSAAITLHSAFNLSIINGTTSDTLKAFAWVWGAVIILMILFEEIKVVKPKVS
jgi:hypothetical protein